MWAETISKTLVGWFLSHSQEQNQAALKVWFFKSGQCTSYFSTSATNVALLWQFDYSFVLMSGSDSHFRPAMDIYAGGGGDDALVWLFMLGTVWTKLKRSSLIGSFRSDNVMCVFQFAWMIMWLYCGEHSFHQMMHVRNLWFMSVHIVAVSTRI